MSEQSVKEMAAAGLDAIRAVSAKLAEVTAERDSEAAWAEEYHREWQAAKAELDTARVWLSRAVAFAVGNNVTIRRWDDGLWRIECRGMILRDDGGWSLGSSGLASAAFRSYDLAFENFDRWCPVEEASP